MWHWMTTTAAQAEQAAAQAQSAAAAFETVFASVVPPPMIALNRAELSQAMATNVLGQNNGIIAQLEAQYAQLWAQNAAAMYSYAGQSAAATKVTPFTAAPAVANPAAAAATQIREHLGRLDPADPAELPHPDPDDVEPAGHAERDEYAGVGSSRRGNPLLTRTLVPVHRADHAARRTSGRS